MEKDDRLNLPFTGIMSFDPESAKAGLRDYYDFATYNQSTQGHWNGTDGLCFVRRDYPAPQ